MTPLKPGLRLKSAVCDTQIMLVKAPAGEHLLACGGVPMIALTENPPQGVALDPQLSGGTLVGKRYTDAAEQFEFLCTKGGKGSLTLDSAPLLVKQVKALPSSD
jgi:hypothetical protein